MGMFKPIAALTLSIFILAGCAERTPQIAFNPPDIARWAKPDTDVVALLSIEPNECLKSADQSSELQTIALGRMAFRSPFLLGGQATRRGLTCQACHTQGAVNEHFFVVGLSEEPGTADVSSFHFSDVLGDEVFNPSPIPSLSDGFRNIDPDPSKPDFENFITRLITKEFTGANPSPEIKSALLGYIRALDDNQCQSLTLYGPELLDYKIKVIQQTFQALDQNSFTPATQNFLAAALRVELGRLHTRFPYSTQVQSPLAEISKSLNSRGGDISRDQIMTAAQLWAQLRPEIAKYFDKSLFSPTTIEDWAIKSQSR